MKKRSRGTALQKLTHDSSPLFNSRSVFGVRQPCWRFWNELVALPWFR